MPTYEYACEGCDHSFDLYQSMTDRKLRKCPECGKFKLVRLIGTGSGIIFKGSGFYETDYKRTQPAKDQETTSAASGGAKEDSSASSSKDSSKDSPKESAGTAAK